MQAVISLKDPDELARDLEGLEKYAKEKMFSAAVKYVKSMHQLQ
jgi:hypothetical protein